MILADYRETEPLPTDDPEHAEETINLGIAEVLGAKGQLHVSEEDANEALAMLEPFVELSTPQKIILTLSMLHDLGMVARAEKRLKCQCLPGDGRREGYEIS